MRVFLVLLFALWCAPVKLGAAIRWQEKEKAVCLLGVTIWGFRLMRKVSWPPRESIRILEADGASQAMKPVQQQVEKGAGGDESDRKGMGAVIRLIRATVISNRARSWFRRTAKVECARLQMQVDFSDAAVCALWVGALMGIIGALRRLMPYGQFRIRTAPNEGSAGQGMCIVSIRLGNLILSALMGTLAYAASHPNKKEGKKWSIIPLKN